jgi:hypothetical protein
MAAFCLSAARRAAIPPAPGGKACRVNPAGRRGIPVPGSAPTPAHRRVFSKWAAKSPGQVLA